MASNNNAGVRRCSGRANRCQQRAARHVRAGDSPTVSGSVRMEAWHDVLEGVEVGAVSSLVEQPGPDPEDDLTCDELARRQGVEPVTSSAELAQPDLRDSDEGYEDFLTDRYASRRSGAA